MNTDEIKKLSAMLTKEGIEHELNNLWDGLQIILPNGGDVIQHGFSYGGKEGYLETMGISHLKDDNDDEVEGWLTAEQVLEQIKKDL